MRCAYRTPATTFHRTRPCLGRCLICLAQAVEGEPVRLLLEGGVVLYPPQETACASALIRNALAFDHGGELPTILLPAISVTTMVELLRLMRCESTGEDWASDCAPKEAETLLRLASAANFLECPRTLRRLCVLTARALQDTHSGRRCS